MIFVSKFARYFLEVATHGSIRKASDRLHVAASAIDRQILNGEQVLGLRLFDRRPGGLRLTPAGEAVVRQLGRWSREEAALARELEGLRRGDGGEIRLAVADGLAAGFVPALVMRLRERHPKMRFRVVVTNAAASAALVRNGECDVGLTFDPPSFAGLSVVREVASRLGVLTPRGHPLCGRKVLRPEDCTAYPVVAPDVATALWQAIERLFADAASGFEIVFHSNNVALLCDMVRQGLGIAFLRDLDAIGVLDGGDLVFSPFQDVEMPAQKLSLIVAGDRPLASAPGLILAELDRALAALVSAPGAR